MRLAPHHTCLLAVGLTAACAVAPIAGVGPVDAQARPNGARPGTASVTSSGSRSLGLAAKLDPRLLDAVAAMGPDPISVWLTFIDKGERDRWDLAARLNEAEAALTPRARARRLRAHVLPLVDYRDLPVAPDYLAELGQRGLGVVAVSRWFNRAAVRVPAGRFEELAGLPWVATIAPVERMMRSGGEPVAIEPPPDPAAFAGPTGTGRATATSAIDYGRTLEMLQQMNVPAVHDSGFIGTGVVVCIVDDGFNYHQKHEALRNVVIAPGYKRDFTQGDSIVIDTTIAGLRHGTEVMGTIAGNLQGAYVGSGFGAQFALARTEVDASETPVEMLYWGMAAEWAESLGVDVITSSLGYSTFDNPVFDYTYADMNGRTTDVSRAAEIAASKGILLVNAVGNEGLNSWHYLIAPSDVATDSMIAVGAVDQNGTVASFSSYGPNAAGDIKPDLAARGYSNWVVSTDGNPNTYGGDSGTSFATPLLAGLAACLLQARPSWTPTLISRALRETASRAANPDDRIGWGIPDGLAALRWAPPNTSVPPPPRRFGIRLLGPNPLHAQDVPLTIQFGLGEGSHVPAPVRVRVFDAQGRAVRELFSGPILTPDSVTVRWDGRDDHGTPVHTGLYFIALEALGERRGARVIVLP